MWLGLMSTLASSVINIFLINILQFYHYAIDKCDISKQLGNYPRKQEISQVTTTIFLVLLAT